VQKDKEAAAQNFAKAIQNLQIAKQNARFFPNVHYDEAVHDTYYYTALSYHKLYLITRKNNLLSNATSRGGSTLISSPGSSRKRQL